jgi:hypothetical protein
MLLLFQHIKLIKSIRLKKKGDSGKSGSRSDVMDNAQLVVNSVHITIQTLGGSLMMIDLEDIVIQSTNGSWQVQFSLPLPHFPSSASICRLWIWATLGPWTRNKDWSTCTNASLYVLSL